MQSLLFPDHHTPMVIFQVSFWCLRVDQTFPCFPQRNISMCWLSLLLLQVFSEMFETYFWTAVFPSYFENFSHFQSSGHLLKLSGRHTVRWCCLLWKPKYLWKKRSAWEHLPARGWYKRWRWKKILSKNLAVLRSPSSRLLSFTFCLAPSFFFHSSPEHLEIPLSVTC